MKSMSVTEWLGYSGLIPFVGCAIGVSLGIEEAAVVFQLYSIVILAFMAGACWGVIQADSEMPETSSQIWSIAICLWGLLAYFMPYVLSIIMLFIAFVTLLWLEKSPLFQQAYSTSYKKLRMILTTVVALAHAAVIATVI